jgi:two-component system chemotaxis sensor kinase CheA
MSDYLDPNNEELLKDFLSEATLQVELLEQNVLAIEDDPDDRDAIDEIFRAAHTLKGGSATVQMTELAEFTHLVEDLLDAIRSEKVRINSGVVDTLLTAIDIIKLMLETRQSGDVYTDDISKIKKDLKALIDGQKVQTEKSGTKSVKTVSGKLKSTPAPRPESVVAEPQVLSEYEILELKEAAGKGNKVHLVRVTFDESNPMNTVGGIQIFAKLKSFTQVLKTNPDFELLYEDNFFPVVDYYVACDMDPKEMEEKASTPDVTLLVRVSSLEDNAAPDPSIIAPPVVKKVIVPDVSAEYSREEDDLESLENPQETADDDNDDDSVTTESIQEASASLKNKLKDKNTGSVLRVDSKRIDNLLNLVSEAVINKATFNQISSRFSDLQSEFLGSENAFKDNLKNLFEKLPEMLESTRDSQDPKELKEYLATNYQTLAGSFEALDSKMKNLLGSFKSTAANLGRNTGDLHEAILRIRMVPINQIFSRFPRLVRDLSKTLDKRIDLLIEGEDTELDKSVIEELLDPLMHCVRNSLDHGVESITDRLRKGKPETGRILLKASNEGNMIIIEVSDDGAGIDVKAVKDKAVKKGLIHPGKNLSDVEAYNLIFEPGFSTAKEVTNISGRGVGLDVVKREIEKLNGSVSVWSRPDEGTRFTIKLPLTLAIIQGLLVRVGQEIYAIPITSVIESLRIKPQEISIIDNYEVFNIRNDVISLLRLNKLFNIETSDSREFNFIVIVGSGDKKMGLMVDSLIGEEDVVIKPLKDRYTNSPGIAGATILGDGTVSLIIDVSQLLDLGVQLEQKTRNAVAV